MKLLTSLAICAACSAPPQAPLSAASGPRGAILPVYRNLGAATPLTDARYAAQCGAGTGPFEVLRPTTSRDQAAAIRRAIDAAGVPRLVEEALAEAERRLPGPAVTICLYPGELTGGLPYLHGVGGVSLGLGHIKLFLHPAPGGLRRVPYAVAHEYFHEVERVEGAAAGPMDIVIREGKADYFLEYQKAPSPTFRADFMIGRNPAVTPWPGYRLGYEMVSSYLKDKRLAPSDWIPISAETFFDHFRANSRPARLPSGD